MRLSKSFAMGVLLPRLLRGVVFAAVKHEIFAIPLLTLSLLFASNSLAAPPDLASADWSVKAPSNLAAKPPSDDAVVAFVSKMGEFGSHFGICSSHFADLRHSGNLSLVVSISVGRFCDLSIYDKTSAGFEVSSPQLGHYADGPEIKDLAGDGNLELIVPTDFTSYDGTQHCLAQWPVIYAWTGSTYGDVSSQYKGYYERQLASLQKELAATAAQNEGLTQGAAGPAAGAASGAPTGQQPGGGRAVSPDNGSQVLGVMHGPNGSVNTLSAVGPRFSLSSPPTQPPAAPEPGRLGLDCDKAEAAKLERFLGISREAGMRDAIKWADSDNPDDREFAADVLTDIGTPAAIEYLKTLSRDPVKMVAAFAKGGLVQVSQGPVVHTVDQEPVTDDAGKPIQ